MAKHTEVVITDDIDGGTGAETRFFGIDGVSYEIDLCTANYKKLEKALEPFIKVARRQGHKRVTAKRVTKPTSSADLGAIRDWARQQGKTVSDRGRIPKDIVDQFHATHGELFSHAS